MKILGLVLGFLLICSPCFATDYTQDINCQGAWLLDIDQDPVVDSSQNSYTGALTAADNPDFATATPPAAYSTGYYVFDGDDDRINCGDIAEVDGATALTVVFWAKCDVTTEDASLVSKGQHNIEMPLLIWRDEAVGAGEQATNTDALSIIVYDGDTQGWISSDTGTLNDTDWHHYGLTFAANSGTGLKIYIDGVLGQTGTTVGVNTIQASAYVFGMGMASQDGTPLDGDMDEVAVFDRVLDVSEILDIKNNGLAGAVVADASQVIMIYD